MQLIVTGKQKRSIKRYCQLFRNTKIMFEIGYKNASLEKSHIGSKGENES